MIRAKHIFSLILAVLWTAFIVYGLLSEPSGIPRFPWLVKPGVDKLIHLILFLVESVLIANLVYDLKLKSSKLIVLIWAFVLGGALEVIQYFWINGRSGEVLDLGADMLGAVIGVWVFTRFWIKNRGIMESD